MKNLITLFILLVLVCGCSQKVTDEKLQQDLTNNFTRYDKKTVINKWEIVETRNEDSGVKYMIKANIYTANQLVTTTKNGTHNYVMQVFYKKYGSDYIFQNVTDLKMVD